MAFTFDQIFAADPSNPSNVAQNAAVTIFAPGDGTMAPLTITDPDGQPLSNPIPVNANGFGSAFAHATLDRVAWAGGGFTGFFTSYEGMKNEAVAAREAAEQAAANMSGAYAKLEVVQLSDHLDPDRIEGTTDDAPALTAALAALPAEGGRLVWARANVRIASAVTIDKPVTVLGAHRGKSKITVTATKLITCAASDVTFTDIGFHGAGLPDGSVLFNDHSTVGNHKNWRFERCVFNACGIVRFTKIGRIQATGTPAPLGTDIASGVALVGCEVTGIRSAYAVEIGGIDGVLVEGCHIHHNGIDTNNGEGLKILASSNNVRVAFNEINNNTRDGIDIYDVLTATVIGNDIHDNAINGIEAKWATTDAHTVDKFIVTANRVYGNQAGLNVDVPLSLITNNQIYSNTGTGIRIGAAFDSATTATKHSTVSNNVVYGNTSDGILVTNAGDSLTITANQSHTNGGSGIAFGASTVGVIISLNQCFGNTNKGISIAGTGHTIGANRTQDTGNYFLLAGSTGHTITPTVGAAQTGIFATSYYYGPLGGRSTVTMASGLLTFVPFWVGSSASFTRIGCEVTTAAAGSTIRLGIYKDGGSGLPGALVLDAGTVDSATTGAKELTIAQTLAPGLYWLAMHAEGGAPIVRSVSGANLAPVGYGTLTGATGSAIAAGHFKTGVAGSLPSPAGSLNGQSAGPGVVVLKAG